MERRSPACLEEARLAELVLTLVLEPVQVLVPGLELELALALELVLVGRDRALSGLLVLSEALGPQVDQARPEELLRDLWVDLWVDQDQDQLGSAEELVRPVLPLVRPTSHFHHE